ncbi:MAG: diguanylate cyclase [Ignavibacteria bacterium]|nr:MAG: diguanylate cyclase [Ignavibacteria bacterium]
MISTIKKRIPDFMSRINSSDGLLLALGISAIVIGILVDLFFIRLLCLFVVIGTAILLYALMRVRQMNLHSEAGGANSPFHSQFASEGMKKLVFDDLQPQSGEKYVIREIEEDAASPEPVPAGETVPGSPSGVTPYQGFAAHKHEILPAAREFQMSDFFDIDSDIYRGDPEPRTEFNFLLHKVLTVIKEVLFAHSVVFLWANREKGQMVIEARVSDGSNFITSRRFVMGHDLASKVAESGKPELVTEVNPRSELEMLPYYDTPDSIKSFVGVPVYFSRRMKEHAIERPVGVIAVDSKAADEFGEETLSLLGQFTKLVSALIKSYTDKYDLLLDSELLRSIRRMQERIRKSFSLNVILQSLADETSKLINWDCLSVVLYDERKHSWLAKKVTNRSLESYLVLEQTIDFPGSIVGQTISQNTHALVDDLEGSRSPRYFAGEKAERAGSFISVPISSVNKCYGALNVESRDKYNFSRQDVEMLYRLAENAASALEILYLKEVISEYVIVDPLTGVYSRKYFLQRLDEELQRADDSGIELSFLLISIDKSSEIGDRFDIEGLDRIVVSLAKAVRASIRPYDLAGRYDSDCFGVILNNTAASEAYLWAEKIRKNVAGQVINLEGTSFSITVSIGVCGALESMRKEELLGDAAAVLHKATASGGNAVRVF